MRVRLIILTALVALLAALCVVFYFKFYPALKPVISRPIIDVTQEIPTYTPPASEPSSPSDEASPIQLPAYTGPLMVPEGFSVQIYASGFRKPRILAQDPRGRLAVSDTDAGIIYVLEERQVVVSTPLVTGLDRPHGIEFYDNYLYVAETRAVSRYRYDAESVRVGPREQLFTLPFSGGHFTRTLRFGADGALYISIGSSCNVCREQDERFATIMRYEYGTWHSSVYARGLRNTVGFVKHPETGELWGVDNGRDWLGDDMPPEELNIIRAGGDYGWPICYGNKMHDTDFDKNQYIRDPCADTIPPVFELPAHNAPLGLTFITSTAFPHDWQGDLFVTLHGSWNRSIPDGYKVVRLRVAGDRILGSEDFMTGFITRTGVVGRPVDVLFGRDGALYITDDRANVIYRVSVDGN